jgi:hypothetical protein
MKDEIFVSHERDILSPRAVDYIRGGCPALKMWVAAEPCKLGSVCGSLHVDISCRNDVELTKAKFVL